MDAEDPGVVAPPPAEPGRAQPRPTPRLDAASRARIGRELRAHYAGLLDAPLGPGLAKLTAALLASQLEEVDS